MSGRDWHEVGVTLTAPACPAWCELPDWHDLPPAQRWPHDGVVLREHSRLLLQNDDLAYLDLTRRDVSAGPHGPWMVGATQLELSAATPITPAQARLLAEQLIAGAAIVENDLVGA